MKNKAIDELNAEQKIKIDLAERAGLIWTGYEKSGELQFLGDTEAWDRYSNLLEDFNNNI